MGRIRNWIVTNPFFQRGGKFSKPAFIMMNTWVFVMIRYVLDGLTWSTTVKEHIVLGITIPAKVVTYTVKFDWTAGGALLMLVFSLYFSNKLPMVNNNPTLPVENGDK